MISLKAVFFVGVTNNGVVLRHVFLNIRNRILQMWTGDPKTQLRVVSVLRYIEKLFSNDEPLIKKIRAS